MGPQCGSQYLKLRLKRKPFFSNQRFAARFITWSIKTALTDTLLLLANLLPLDLLLTKLTSIRYLTMIPIVCFSPSSLKNLF
jgi:hypothetical protein